MKPLVDAIAFWKAAGHARHEAESVPLALSGKAMTLKVRWHVDKNTSAGELLGWRDRSSRPVGRLFTREGERGLEVAAELRTDANDQPLLLSASLAALGPDRPHDLLLRYSGDRLELFADGVLVDEEWPMGSLPPADGTLQIASGGAIEHAVVWNRALADEEAHHLLAGNEPVAEREDRILGPQTPIRQFWSPRGFNTQVGDCMPFFHEGRFHLFYLLDRRNHRSKWGLGGHRWAHASTTDLVHWEHHPTAVAIAREGEGSVCTGSVFFHAGVYYAFYSIRMPAQAPSLLGYSLSDDGVHFARQPLIGTLKDPYQAPPARDPVVFRDPSTGSFHMLATASLQKPAAADRAGCLAHLVSSDLKQWEQREPFLVPDYPGEPECPDVFSWHGWHYLIFSNRAVARYQMARHPLGPWQRPPLPELDSPQAAVMKTAAFTGDRRIGAAFLGRGGYGGEIVFRELIPYADGTLGIKWCPETVPPAGAPAPLKKRFIAGETIAEAPRDFLLRARVTPSPGVARFGLRLRAAKSKPEGIELRFEPRREKAGLHDLLLGPADEGESTSIWQVSALDRPFDLELLVKGDAVDVCVDHRRTLVARMSGSGGDGIFVFADGGGVELSEVELRPLVT